MPRDAAKPKTHRRKPIKERRAPRNKRNPLGWIKGLLSRPLSLQRRDGRWHLVLVDRRRAPAHLTLETAALREELRERMLCHAHEAAHAMRHIVRVHDTLGREGWAGIQALPSRTLRKALVQAEMLRSEQPSALIAGLTDKLRVMQVAAELREERAARAPTTPAAASTATREAASAAAIAAARAALSEPDSQVEVSDATVEEFDATERSWVGTLPQALDKPQS